MKVFLVLLLATSTLAANLKRIDWRIVGGSDAPDGAYPYQISLRYRGNHNCGGSIVDATTILTAAHCVDGYSASLLTVVVGTNTLNAGGDSYQVKVVRPHERYNSFIIKNDIAIVKLASPIQFNDKVQPIDLETDYVEGGVDCVLSGWGSTSYPGSAPNNLQHINLKTFDVTECANRLNSGFVDDTQVCTLTVRGEGACHGDSGGPLVAGKQIGIVSFGRPCAQGYPDVFTRVSAYTEWIDINDY